MGNPKISIVIRTLNAARWLPELLTAIGVQQLNNFAVETILVDSGSTDGTIAIAERFGCRITRIHKSDFTFGRSLNVGCEAATGEILVFVSGHCVPIGDRWLESLCQPINDERCDYTYGRQVWREGYSKFSERQLLQKYFPETSRIPQDDFFCNNANAALRRSTWERYQFDEDVTGLEDMVLAKALWDDGGKIGYVAEAAVEHIHEENWQQVKRRYEREAIALQGIMPAVHVSFGDFVRYSIAGIMLDCATALQERRLWREITDIFMFRIMQYWGTYRGNNDHRKLSREAKERYFYPR